MKGMSQMSVLKGNYKIKNVVKNKNEQATKIEEGFEEYASKHLGGSIAFIMKDNTFLIDDEGDKLDKNA